MDLTVGASKHSPEPGAVYFNRFQLLYFILFHCTPARLCKVLRQEDPASRVVRTFSRRHLGRARKGRSDRGALVTSTGARRGALSSP